MRKIKKDESAEEKEIEADAEKGADEMEKAEI